MGGVLTLHKYQVVTPFPVFVDNGDIEDWWTYRKEWIDLIGDGPYNAYRIPVAFACIVDSHWSPEGNNNIESFVLWSFDDSHTAAMFKLTFG